MSYMLLIVEPVGQRQRRTEAEGRELYAQMQRFGDTLRARGQLLASESLKSQTDAARVEVRQGKSHVLDGPFAEAKEMIGGFFLLNCDTRQEAVAIATECPAAAWCTVEVREVAPCYVSVGPAPGVERGSWDVRGLAWSRLSKRQAAVRRRHEGPGGHAGRTTLQTHSRSSPMRFMILVRATAQSESEAAPNDDEQLMAAMADYPEQLAQAGVLLDANGLRATSLGWRIRYSGGQRRLVDGPFTETKELVAGYTLIQVRSREEALEWTRRFPAPMGDQQDAEIEVRQLFELEDFNQGEAVQRFNKLHLGTGASA